MTVQQLGRLDLAAGGIRPVLARHAHHLLLAVWLVGCVAVYGRHGGQSWHFFATGARSLLCLPERGAGPCGLHVYAQNPDLQIGPLTLLLAAPAVLLGHGDGLNLARLGMAVAGFVVLLLVERGAAIRDPVDPVDPVDPIDLVGAVDARRVRRRVLLAGLAFLPAWADLSVGFGHLDDVLALLFTAAAVQAVRARRPGMTGWLLAAATVCKPWAVAFLPLVWALPKGRRWSAILPAVILPGLAALPFVLADPATLHAAAFRIPNAAASSLRLLGVTDATPRWDRPLQFALGAGLAALAVRRGRWPAVIMIAAAVRIMFDPQVYSYYTAGVLLGTVIWDVQVRRGRVVPVWTWATFIALFACRYVPLPALVLGGLRLVICLVVIVCALFLPGVLARMLPPRAVRPGRRAGSAQQQSGPPEPAHP